MNNIKILFKKLYIVSFCSFSKVLVTGKFGATVASLPPKFKLDSVLFARTACVTVKALIYYSTMEQSMICPKFASKSKQMVLSGVFKAELDEFLRLMLADEGYSGLELRRTARHIDVIISSTRTQNVLGEKGRRIRELTTLVNKRFGFRENFVELYVEKVENRALCAITQAESLRYKLIGGLPVRRACYGILRFIMSNGAKGCVLIVSGKLRGQRAKSMKFCDGIIIHSGDPPRQYVDKAVRHVLLRQGVLGIKVLIMLPYDPKGKLGPSKPLPDSVRVMDVKEEECDKNNLTTA